MELGTGNYQDVVAHTRESQKANAAIVIVMNGQRGTGWAVQGEPDGIEHLPNFLEGIAADIRTSLKKADEKAGE